MVLKLRVYIATSFLLHVLFFYFFALSARDAERMIRARNTVTLRSAKRNVQVTPIPRPKTAKVIQPKKSLKKPAAATRPSAQPLIPVLRPDAPEMELPDEAPQTEISDGVGTSASAGAPVDKSNEAGLIVSTLRKVEMTRDAIRARLQGSVPVDVRLDANGRVLEIEILKPVGFGMDERILNALKEAQYIPKRDSKGNGLETWITIQFKLETL